MAGPLFGLLVLDVVANEVAFKVYTYDARIIEY